MRAAILLFAAGCMPASEFECAEDSQCVRSGEQGRCEVDQRCSFADPDCESGQRYAELSGEQGGACVAPAVGADFDLGSIEGEPVITAPVVCPGFTEIDGRYWKALPAAGWTNQRTACGMIPGNVFLAIPDDATELAAIVEVAGGASWVGISDASAEASYVTVFGTDAEFLPWASAEPDNDGNQDCVRTTGQAIETAICGAPTAAVCECTP